MKFIKLSLSYMSKNIIYLMALSIVPAIFIGLLLSPFKIIEFMNIYSSTPIINFGTIFYGVTDFSFLQLLLWSVGLVLLAIFVAGIIGQIEHHLRSGKLNFSETTEYVNNNVLFIIANLFVMFLLAVVLMFLTSTILFLIHLIFSGINTSPTVFNVILSNVVMAGIFVLYSLIASTFFINISNMMTNGYPFRHSLSSTSKLHQKNSFGLIVGVLAPMLVVTVLISIFIKVAAFMPFLSIICVWFLIMYYASFSVTAYYALTSTKRFDNVRKYYYK